MRGVLGMPVEDNTRLVPIDAPTVAPYTPDWQSATSRDAPDCVDVHPQTASVGLQLFGPPQTIRPAGDEHCVQPMGFYSPSTILQDAQKHGVIVLPVALPHALFFDPEHLLR